MPPPVVMQPVQEAQQTAPAQPAAPQPAAPPAATQPATQPVAFQQPAVPAQPEAPAAPVPTQNAAPAAPPQNVEADLPIAQDLTEFTSAPTAEAGNSTPESPPQPEPAAFVNPDADIPVAQDISEFMTNLGPDAPKENQADKAPKPDKIDDGFVVSFGDESDEQPAAKATEEGSQAQEPKADDKPDVDPDLPYMVELPDVS